MDDNTMDDYEYTIKEISIELGVSKEKARQMLLVALKKLEKTIHEGKFSEILEYMEKSND